MGNQTHPSMYSKNAVWKDGVKIRWWTVGDSNPGPWD